MIVQIRHINIWINQILAWSFRATRSAILTAAVITCAVLLAACAVPSSKETLNQRGNAHYAQQEYDQAIADYTEVIRLDPKFSAAYFNRGNAYVAQQKYAEAIADFNEATHIDPKNGQAFCNLGGVRSRTGRKAGHTIAISLVQNSTGKCETGNTDTLI